MSSFAKTLERLREATAQRSQHHTTTVVPILDLRELLEHFVRLDADARMGYPPHIKELADAAEKALAQVPRGAVRDQLEFALNLVRPERVARKGGNDGRQ